MTTVEVLEGQTIFDIAMQEYGNHLCVFTLREDAPFLIPDLNALLTPCQLVRIRTDLSQVPDARVKLVAHYKKNSIKVISNAQ